MLITNNVTLVGAIAVIDHAHIYAREDEWADLLELWMDDGGSHARCSNDAGVVRTWSARDWVEYEVMGAETRN